MVKRSWDKEGTARLFDLTREFVLGHLTLASMNVVAGATRAGGLTSIISRHTEEEERRMAYVARYGGSGDDYRCPVNDTGLGDPGSCTAIV